MTQGAGHHIVCLGEIQDVRLTGLSSGFWWEITQAALGDLSLTQRSQTGVRTGDDARVFFIIDEVVLPISDKDERAGFHPPKQFGHLERLSIDAGHKPRSTGYCFGLPLFELVGNFECARSHRPPVLDGAADVGEHRVQLVLKIFKCGRSRQTVDLDMHRRLDVLRRRSRHLDRPDLPGIGTFDVKQRVDQQVHLMAKPLEQGQHRVDDEGHVFADDVDHGMAATPTIFVAVRVVDLHQGFIGRPAFGKLQVPNGRCV